MTFIAALSVMALVTGACAAADYAIQAGDEVEIAIAGMPDSKQRSTVGSDGTVEVPYVGSMKAQGLSLSAFRSSLQASLSRRSARRMSASGQETVYAIDPDDISVSMSAYRPVYLVGDVAKPGEQRFRPGMTVQQAVSLSGGYDILRVRMENPFLISADQKAEYDSLRADYAVENVRWSRLKAEFDRRPTFELRSGALGIDPALQKTIVELEIERFAVRQADNRKEKESLSIRIQQAQKQLADLSEQQRTEAEGVKADNQELANITELLKRGTTSTQRVTDSRRAFLLSSTRLLQTTALIAQIQRDTEELSRRLGRMDDTQRLQVSLELQDASVKLESLRSRIKAVGEKLSYTGMVRSQLVRDSASRPEVVVKRRSNGEMTRLDADEDTELAPGDLVDVSLRASAYPAPPVDFAASTGSEVRTAPQSLR